MRCCPVSTIDKNKIEILKDMLRSLHKGESVENLKQKLKNILKEISPFEIPLVEQELIKEGVPISEIFKLCDLHVELLKDALRSNELKDVPDGHPLNLLSKENMYITKFVKTMNIYMELLNKDSLDAVNYLKAINNVVFELKKFRLHYRKIQMLIFPYLERRGITAIPRVLWSKEDQVIIKLRELSMLIEKGLSNPKEFINNIVEKAKEVSNAISDLIFREEKILFPAVWILLSEGEWAAIHEAAKDIGYLVPIDVEWIPEAKPVLPYEVKGVVTQEQLKNLPQEFKFAALSTLSPDTYEIKVKNDLEFTTGFLSKDEIEAVFKHLPIEVTYADHNDRVTFFSQSKFRKGFVRAKITIGRRFEYCHPPRLENFVKNVVNELKSGKADFKEYWTKLGDRIIRVIVIAVKNDVNAYLGTLEIVEDLTEIVNNPEEIKKKIIIL